MSYISENISIKKAEEIIRSMKVEDMGSVSLQDKETGSTEEVANYYIFENTKSNELPERILAVCYFKYGKIRICDTYYGGGDYKMISKLLEEAGRRRMTNE